MITEKPKSIGIVNDHNKSYQHILKITKETANKLVLTDGHKEMIFKIYDVQQEQSIAILKKREQLHHQALIRVYKVQSDCDMRNADDVAASINCGILFEKYTKTLLQGVKQMISFTSQEVISTLEPIKEVIDYLISQKYDPGELTLSCIVCTEDYQIKFMDSYLHQSSINLSQRIDFSFHLYEQLGNIMFNLLFPDDINIKSWKCRYKVAELKLKKKQMIFFKDVYSHFAMVPSDLSKTKPIKRNEYRRGKKVQVKADKIDKDGLGRKGKICKTKIKIRPLDQNVEYQQGKQNQIIQ